MNQLPFRICDLEKPGDYNIKGAGKRAGPAEIFSKNPVLYIDSPELRAYYAPWSKVEHSG